MRRSMNPLLISAAAAHSSKYAQRFMRLARLKGKDMTTNTNISRRHFVIGSSAIATGLAIGFDLTFMSAANAAVGSGASAMAP